MTQPFEREDLIVAKIQVKTPLVELDGDEMTRIIWAWKKPIILGRHAYGDLYRSVEMLKDLVPLMDPRPASYRSTEGFIDAVAAKLKAMM